MSDAEPSLLRRAIADALLGLPALAALEEPLEFAANVVSSALGHGNKLLLCGNGGSAADATHMATEFMVRFNRDRKPYPALALGANGDQLTALVNDYHPDDIFARQVEALGRTGDVLIVFTTSGSSKNIQRAVAAAREIGVWTIAFLGRDGGFVKGCSSVDLLVPGTSTARIQEAHQLLFHVLCEMVEPNL